MWICRRCGVDVETGFEICWSCGALPDGTKPAQGSSDAAGIMEESTYDAMQARRVQENLITVATFWNAAEAHVLCSRLEAEGVHAVVTDELATSTLWGLANTAGGVKLEVPEPDEERARKILAACEEEHENRRHGLVRPGESDEDDAESADEALHSPEHLALNAYRAAIFGFITLPFILHVYSAYILIRLMLMPGDLSPLGERRCWIALLVDLAVFGFVSLSIYTLFFHRW
jgi:hypothetical protein